MTSAGDTARLWTLEEPAAEQVAFKQGSAIYSAFAVSRDGKHAATAGKGERVIKVWNLETGSPEPIATIDVAGAWVMGLAFSPDGCCLATANEGLAWANSHRGLEHQDRGENPQRSQSRAQRRSHVHP